MFIVSDLVSLTGPYGKLKRKIQEMMKQRHNSNVTSIGQELEINFSFIYRSTYY